MLVAEKNLLILNKLSGSMFVKKTGRKFGTTLAKKTDSSSKDGELVFPRLRVGNTILARSLVAVLGLGFIDAGYSGDWSRIGVISKQSEDLLKLAAFLVVPLCLVLIFSVSSEQED